MNAEQLLNLLEKRGLLEPAMVKNLRRQVEDAAGSVPPERVLLGFFFCPSVFFSQHHLAVTTCPVPS